MSLAMGQEGRQPKRVRWKRDSVREDQGGKWQGGRDLHHASA